MAKIHAVLKRVCGSRQGNRGHDISAAMLQVSIAMITAFGCVENYRCLIYVSICSSLWTSKKLLLCLHSFWCWHFRQMVM